MWGGRDGVKQSGFVEGDGDWRRWLPDLTPPPQLHVKNPASFLALRTHADKRYISVIIIVIIIISWGGN